jgi:predicted AAA+ superfamily ATPase
MINREYYLRQLIAKQGNGLVKTITGPRRAGKSYLLFVIFKQYLKSAGVSDDQIVEVALDHGDQMVLRNPMELEKYIRSRILDTSVKHYVFIDEIQLSVKVKNPLMDETVIAEEDRYLAYITFYDVLNDLLGMQNLDIYVTGSNSRMLSKDIATNFRGRSCEIRVFPLCFSEFLSYVRLEKDDAWDQHMTYGGMPQVVLDDDSKGKRDFLSQLMKNVYQKDIVDRYHLKDDLVLENLIKILFSSIGSLTNPHKLVATIASVLNVKTTDATVKSLLDHLEDAFLFEKAKRYDIKGKSYLSSPCKYYAIDVGLRNAFLGYRQQEKTHLMENIIYNELVMRGYGVDVGVVTLNQRREGVLRQSQHEIDFVVNTGFQKIYIQSAFSIEDSEKRQNGILPLEKTNDSFRKMVVTSGNQEAWCDEEGITYVGVIPFLLNKTILQ